MADSPAQSLEALLEDLKSDDIPKKANAMRNITIIGNALGFDRCKNELIPYLIEFLDDDEEVLISMAEVIPKLFECVGGKNHAYILLEILEKLCAIEDFPVCTAAITSFKQLLTAIDCNKHEILILDQINRMNSSEWLNSKLTLCSILPMIVKDLSPEGQSVVLDIFRSLVTNSNPQVRKQAAENFKYFTGKISPRQESNLQDLLGLIGVDKEDSVRIIAVEDLLSHFAVVGVKNNSSLMPVFRMLMDDKSWRVRYLIAEKLPEFAAVMASEQKSAVLVSAMSKFLQDNEPEVRTGACRKLVDFCKLITVDEILVHIIPVLSPLISDVEYVKATFANNIVKLMPLIGKNHSAQHLLPLILEILRDNSAEIKICIFSDLEGIFSVVGAENLSQIIMPSLEELSEDKQWRVKLKIAQCFPLLGKQLGVGFFEEHFLPVILKLLFDSVYSVRDGVTLVIKDLFPIFGAKWIENNIVKDMCEKKNDDIYSRRITLILFIKTLATFFSADFLIGMIIPCVNDMASDHVANIRLNVVKVVKEIYGSVKDPQAKDNLKITLRLLNKDEDTDVRYYAEQALRICG